MAPEPGTEVLQQSGEPRPVTTPTVLEIQTKQDNTPPAVPSTKTVDQPVTRTNPESPTMQGLSDLLQKVIGITAEELSEESRAELITIQQASNPQEFKDRLEKLLPQLRAQMRDKDKAEQLQKLEGMIGNMTPENVFTALKDEASNSVPAANQEEVQQDIAELEEAANNPDTNWNKIKGLINKLGNFLSMGWLMTFLLNILNSINRRVTGFAAKIASV